MENKLYTKIYDNIFNKKTLESILSNLEALKSRMENTKKASKKKVEEEVEKSITNPILKEIFNEEIKKDNLSVFTEKSLTSLVSKVQDITNTCKIIDITLAIPLSETDLKELGQVVEKKFNQKVILNTRIDPNIIGGVIVKENKYIFDASLKNHLKTYENEWMKSLRRVRKGSQETDEIAS